MCEETTMRIEKLKTNHFENPLGCTLDYLFFSWEITDTDAKTDKWTRIKIAQNEEMAEVLYDTGRMENYGLPYYQADFNLQTATRYYWQIELETDKGEKQSKTAWFETALSLKDSEAEWISPCVEEKAMPKLYKTFTVDKPVKRGRLYCYGQGLYEGYLGSKKIGDEFLSPGYHSYDFIQQYQTFDVTDLLVQGENELAFLLGEGWYKGRFVFEGGYENLYGNRKMLIGVLDITYMDDSKVRICTDRTWKGVQTEILDNNIYDGEVIDRTEKCEEVPVEVVWETKEKLMPRLSVPLRKVERLEVKKVHITPTGKTVLDFGETVTGWVEVHGNGYMDFKLQYSEHMQNGELHRENLRTAKAEFSFKGEVQDEWLRPHFTYYGFRYVSVEGIEQIRKEDFTAFRLMSDIEEAGEIKTSNEKINTLVENTRRSQKCNFIDVPLDCPQRDERMGWTGDIAVFARTGSFHMDTPAFLHHYMVNLQREQEALEGAVPFFVPKPKVKPHEGINPFLVTAGACTWGDAATIVPWELYLHYRDKEMLKLHYPTMCAWVEYINGRVSENEKPFLWQNDRQLGDWLALDNGNIHNPIGSTDMGLIATAYYYYSTVLCKRAAEVLEKREEAARWEAQAEKIKCAFIREYLNESGELVGNATQTAYAILLFMGLYEPGKKQVLIEGMKDALKEYNDHLSTGFVGTSMLMQALSENEMNEEAYTLLLQEDYPSWLREVNLGATTIWERWNSVNDDGIICDEGMNSLNHYTYGCVAGWMYEKMCGFGWDEDGAFYIKPMPDKRIREVKGSCKTVHGTCQVTWRYGEDERLEVGVQIPFQMKALLELPWGEKKVLETGNYWFSS